MQFAKNKTKIVCTIGPASNSHQTLCDMINAGMNVARLNFSHGDFDSHSENIAAIRKAAETVGKAVTIMADLPGPKMRIGIIKEDKVTLNHDDTVMLTTDDIEGDAARFSVSFKRLPKAVKEGDRLFLNDGYIQLEVEEIMPDGTDVRCKVITGGSLSSRKGLNLPGIHLGISAFTDKDYKILRFALNEGIEAVSQSFVENAEDIKNVRTAAEDLGYKPFIIAKIERMDAYQNLNQILEVADGIMIARGDLGVELPIEKMAVIQKKIMRAANEAGRPVITATQMLESMTVNSRPTRAEATDVANAILDGTDCVMLSGESAMGEYPVESVGMLAQIAANTEAYAFTLKREEQIACEVFYDGYNFTNLLAQTVETALHYVKPAAIIVPSMSGHMARRVSRRRLPEWISGITNSRKTAGDLAFSYGVEPVYLDDLPDNWTEWSREWVRENKLIGDWVILTEGPSPKNPSASHKMEIIDLTKSE